MKSIFKWMIICFTVAVILPGCQTSENASPESSGEEAVKSVLYTTVVKYTKEKDSDQDYLEIAQRSQKLFPLLEKRVKAFCVNAYNYQDIDGEGTPVYEMNTLHYPIEFDPNGHTIEVSRNYFEFFPAETADGTALQEQLSGDENTLVLLVPEKLKAQEKEVIKAQRERFYFEKVEAANEINKAAGISERIRLTQDDLELRIVYMKDGQRYQLLRPDLITEEDGCVVDPIVRIYSSQTHCNYAHSLLSQWTYFFADTDDPEKAFEQIRPDVNACKAEESFQKVKALFGEAE